MQGNPTQQLKAIISKENKIKDPFRIKKAVTFMINLTQSESDAEDDEDEENSHIAANNTITLQLSLMHCKFTK